MGDHFYFVFPGDTSTDHAVTQVDDAVQAVWPTGTAAPDYARLSASTEVYTWAPQELGSERVSLTLNNAIPAAFVSVGDGASPEQVAQFGARLGLPTVREHTALAAEAPADTGALLRAALAAGPKKDKALFRLVVAGLEAGDATVRGAAIQAAALLAWPALAEHLLLAASVETDDDLKPLLGVALRKCTPGS